MQERAVYVLPMSVLLETMRELAASVTVQAQLAALPQGWNEPCVAELVLVEGRLYACTISTTEGLMLLQQEAAYQVLNRLGTLEWSVRPDGRSSPQDEQPPSPTISKHAPWLVASSLSSEVLASLSRRHKQVLLLSESHKRPEEIARLLRLSVQKVEQILQTLNARHLTKT